MPNSQLILIYEPSTRGALLLEQLFKTGQLVIPARVLRHCSEVQSYLKGSGVYGNRELFPLPNLLILDLSQASSALNLLEWINQHQFLNWFPVFGVGNRIDPQHLQRAFDLGISGFYDLIGDLLSLPRMISRLQWVDGWKFDHSTEPHILRREQFYRIAALATQPLGTVSKS